MKIDAKKLKETIIKKVRKIAENERFYEVPNAKDYVLSDYGRLFYKGKLQKPVYINGEGLYNEYYHIQFDNTIYAGLIRIDHLIALTFRPDEKIGTLVNPHRTNDKFKWRVIDLHIVRNKGEMVNYIQSKIDGVTPTYKGAGEKLGDALKDVEIKDPKIPYIANANAAAITDKTVIKDLLKAQVSSPVMWEQTLYELEKMGVDTIIEVGPGKTIAGFVKKTVPSIKVIGVATPEDIETLAEKLG